MKKYLRFLTILAVVIITAGSVWAQTSKDKPGVVTPFESTNVLQESQFVKPAGYMENGLLFPSLQAGGDRLVALQNNDGGWDWPLDDGDPNNTSPVNTIGPIAMGLAQAYLFTNDAAHLTALTNTGSLLLSKTNNFSPSDGYLANMLDQVFGVTTYSLHVNTNFYGPLAAGTYDRNGAGTLYSTADYVNLIRTSRASQGIPNLAAWDVGMGLVGAASCGAGTAEWIAGVKGEIDELDGADYYDVIGLAGAVYGLAFVGEDFDPTTGEHAAASNINDLADILVSYQISNGGFAWNSGWVIPNDGNEEIQETAYAILALNEVDNLAYQSEMQGAVVYLVSVQLATGGWENYSASGENNEITGEALWAEAIVGNFQEVWVDDDYNSSTLGWGVDHFDNIQDGIAATASGGTVNVYDGTYNETGQIVISKDINIIGDFSGKGLTTITPTSNTGNSGDARGWFLVNDGIEFNMSNVTLDGTGFLVYQAIRNKGFGTFDNVTFNEIKYNESGPDYGGTAIAAFGAPDLNVHVTNSHFSEIGRIGVLYFGDGITGSNFSGNTYIGKGAGNWLDYALDIGSGAVVAVDNCNVSNCLGVTIPGGWTSGAIMATTYWYPGTEALITNCTLTGNTTAIIVGFDGADASTVEAHYNNISGNTYGVTNSGSMIVDALSNWWGDPTGPYHPILNSGGLGNEVGDNVLFDPWFISPTGDDIDIALYATSCSDFEVRLRSLNNISDVTLTNVQFALKWPVSYGVDLVDFVTTYPLGQQGATVEDGGFYYAVFVGVDMAINDWTAGTEYTILSFSHDQAGTGTGDFVIGDDAWTTANNAMYYAELLGVDKTGIIYGNALGVDLGLCPLYITGTFEANDKVYDGNTDATFLTNDLLLDGVKPGDDVSFDVVEIDFSDKDVGVDKVVSITFASITGADAGKYDLFLIGAPTALADITPQPLTAVVIGNPTKPYDGNTDATLTSSNFDIYGLIAGESMTITETFGTYASADVGTHAVTVNLDAGDFVAGAGTLLSNYILPTIAQGDGTITAIPLTITADNKTKIYDGAVFPYGDFTVSYLGFVGGDDESDLGGTLVFSGSAITATAVGTWVITPGGLTSGNYTITFVDGELEITPVTLGITVLLQGPYNSGMGLMNTDLNPTELPNGQPFNVAPWNYYGTETLPGTLTTEVDWVLVELRSDINTMVGRCASLVYSDGSVSVSIDDVNFPGVVAGSDYYIVIWHRNHMPVMSVDAQTVPVTSYDFTVLGNLYGTNPAFDLGGGVFSMIAGDVTANGILKYSGPGNDRGPIIARIVAETGLNDINGFTPPGYWQEDVNLNSIVLYIGTANDRGIIQANLNTLTGTPYLNNTYSSVVPGAITGSKDVGSNDGPFDILISESDSEINVELETSQLIDNGMVDNIQFALAWNTGDTEIENMLSSFASDFVLTPQGEVVELDGIMYQVYVSVTPVYLPQSFNVSEKITVMTIENAFGQSVAERLWIADDAFTAENNAMYFVSVWGSDYTGIIHTASLGINDISNSGAISIYPNPVNNGVLFMQMNTLTSEMLDIKIFDAQGKLVKIIEHQTDEVISNTLSIDVSEFTSGIYLVNVVGETVLFKDRFIVN